MTTKEIFNIVIRSIYADAPTMNEIKSHFSSTESLQYGMIKLAYNSLRKELQGTAEKVAILYEKARQEGKSDPAAEVKSTVSMLLSGPYLKWTLKYLDHEANSVTESISQHNRYRSVNANSASLLLDNMTWEEFAELAAFQF